MVTKTEAKKDVFAGFHLDNVVHDNEDTLAREEEEEMMGTESEFYDDSVFAQFHLDEIVRENEERVRKQKLEKEQQDELHKKRQNSFRGRLEKVVGIEIPGPLFRNKSSNNETTTKQQNHFSLREVGGGDVKRTRGVRSVRWQDGYRENGESARGGKRIYTSEHGNHHGSRRMHHEITHKNSSRGTVTTATQEDVDDSIDGVDTRNGNNLRVHLENLSDSDSGYDDSDDDSFIGNVNNNNKTHNTIDLVVTPSKNGLSIGGVRVTRMASSTAAAVAAASRRPNSNNNAGGGNNGLVGKSIEKREHKCSPAITRSRTGIPIGGMCVSDVESANGAAVSGYHWVSPHSADSIFSDFDLDAIVKEYEELHRKLNFSARDYDDYTSPFNGVDDEDEEEDDDEGDDTTLGNTMVRYRSLRKFWFDHFPRAHGIIFKVILPLWVIVVLTIVLGNILGGFEIHEEVAHNNEIMRSRYDLTRYPYEQTLRFLFGLPTICFETYIARKEGVPNNFTDAMGNNITIDTGVNPLTNLSGWDGTEFPTLSSNHDDQSADVTLEEIKSYMQSCKDSGQSIVTRFVDYTTRQIQAASSDNLSFNWMRCWNTTLYGEVNPLFPSKAQLAVAIDQAAFFAKSWEQDQKALYGRYLEEANCTTSICQNEAHDNSVADATGAGMCDINKGASAWFWFVFMTTVGYGNQSPETTEGRLLVGCLGWICIILWAIILYVAGKVLGIIIDDLFRRCRCRFVTGDLQSAIVWCGVAGVWIGVIGELYRFWFNFTDHPETFDWNPFDWTEDESKYVMNTGDAYWFSYISLLTVGLGDFYLDSESFFYRDLFIWSSSFLVGFTFLSTFLGQIADLTSNIFPDSGESLRHQLTNTKLVGKVDVKFKKENEKGIERLEKLVEVMDDDDIQLITQRLTRIRVKKNLLVHLLYQTKIEMEYYKKRGERYESLSYAKVCQEENMLKEIVYNTEREREKLATYQRSKVERSKTTYFDDGTALDEVQSKLGLRAGKKSIKKRMAASNYL